MTPFIHDVPLGQRPDPREQHRLIFNGRSDPLLLAVLHYLRDEAADCIGRSTGAVRDGFKDTSLMELGAHEILVQAFTKINKLRDEPVEVDA